MNCVALYRETPTWQGLAVTSRSSTSFSVADSDSRVRSLSFGQDYLLMHCVYRLLGPCGSGHPRSELEMPYAKLCCYRSTVFSSTNRRRCQGYSKVVLVPRARKLSNIPSGRVVNF